MLQKLKNFSIFTLVVPFDMFNGLLRFESCHFKPMGKYYICILGKRLRDLHNQVVALPAKLLRNVGVQWEYNYFFENSTIIFFGTFDEGVM